MIAREAAWFQSRCGDGLSKQANALLLRIASLIQAEKNLGSPDIGQQELFPTSVALKKKLKLTEERLYTYNVSVSFDMQYTFTEKEVQPASESGEGGGSDETDPTEEALAALGHEIQECLSDLSENYIVGEVEAFADSDSLLGVMTDNLQEKRDSKYKPSKEEFQAAQGWTLIDVIAPRLKVLFCGINPSLYSAVLGHHFARPGNRFWQMLHDAGFTPRLLSPSEENKLLKYRCGITDIVEGATAGAIELTQSDFENGEQRLTTKVRQYKPEFVTVLGIDAYRKAFKRPKAKIGRQMEPIGEATLWVLPNPSALDGHYQREQLKQLAQELHKAIE